MGTCVDRVAYGPRQALRWRPVLCAGIVRRPDWSSRVLFQLDKLANVAPARPAAQSRYWCSRRTADPRVAPSPFDVIIMSVGHAPSGSPQTSKQKCFWRRANRMDEGQLVAAAVTLHGFGIIFAAKLTSSHRRSNVVVVPRLFMTYLVIHS